MFAFIFCFICLVAQSVTVLKLFFEYPFTVEVLTKYYDDDYLPAITVSYDLRELPEEHRDALKDFVNPNETITTLDTKNDDHYEFINQLKPECRLWRNESGRDGSSGTPADFIPSYQFRFDNKSVYHTFFERPLSKRRTEPYYFSVKSHTFFVMFFFMDQFVKAKPKSDIYYISAHPHQPHTFGNERVFTLDMRHKQHHVLTLSKTTIHYLEPPFETNCRDYAKNGYDSQSHCKFECYRHCNHRQRCYKICEQQCTQVDCFKELYEYIRILEQQSVHWINILRPNEVLVWQYKFKPRFTFIDLLIYVLSTFCLWFGISALSALDVLFTPRQQVLRFIRKYTIYFFIWCLFLFQCSTVIIQYMSRGTIVEGSVIKINKFPLPTFTFAEDEQNNVNLTIYCDKFRVNCEKHQNVLNYYKPQLSYLDLYHLMEGSSIVKCVVLFNNGERNCSELYNDFHGYVYDFFGKLFVPKIANTIMFTRNSFKLIEITLDVKRMFIKDVMVLMHDSDVPPGLADISGIVTTLKPGMEYLQYYRELRFNLLPSPYETNCKNYKQQELKKKYKISLFSRRYCLNRCDLELSAKFCNCTPWYEPTMVDEMPHIKRVDTGCLLVSPVYTECYKRCHQIDCVDRFIRNVKIGYQRISDVYDAQYAKLTVLYPLQFYSLFSLSPKMAIYDLIVYIEGTFSFWFGISLCNFHLYFRFLVTQTNSFVARNTRWKKVLRHIWDILAAAASMSQIILSLYNYITQPKAVNFFIQYHISNDLPGIHLAINSSETNMSDVNYLMNTLETNIHCIVSDKHECYVTHIYTENSKLHYIINLVEGYTNWTNLEGKTNKIFSIETNISIFINIHSLNNSPLLQKFHSFQQIDNNLKSRVLLSYQKTTYNYTQVLGSKCLSKHARLKSKCESHCSRKHNLHVSDKIIKIIYDYRNMSTKTVRYLDKYCIESCMQFDCFHIEYTVFDMGYLYEPQNEAILTIDIMRPDSVHIIDFQYRFVIGLLDVFIYTTTIIGFVYVFDMYSVLVSLISLLMGRRHTLLRRLVRLKRRISNSVYFKVCFTRRRT